MFFNRGKKDKYVSFMTGKIVALEKVGDPVFASKQIGDGFAIEPTAGEVYAPCDGKVVTVFPTGHAFGFQQKNGCEILLHLGIDTVELKGKGFEAFITEGENIKAGDLIARMNLESVRNSGKCVTSMMIFTTGEKIELIDSGEVEAKKELKLIMK